MSTTHIVIIGANGRMGARLCALVRADRQLHLHSAVVREGGALVDGAGAGEERGAAAVAAGAAMPPIPRGAVVIDFSSPAGTEKAMEMASEAGSALVVGTTGLPAGTMEKLRAASARIAVLVAPNTSLGVAVLADVAARAARVLGPGYRASITEAHHAMKKDAPSGTAKRLADAVRGAGGDLPEDQVVAIRGGDVVGEHTVRFAGPGEYLELTHRATSRDLFALGALRAAKWIAGKPAGWYRIEDVVGVREG